MGKNKKKENMKLTNKGFSLIELSIVLIIIGLLVAGITGGASLIKSAELRSVMSEIRNYQTAVNAYYTATGKLPGGLDSDQLDFAKTGVAWNDIFTEGIIDEAPADPTALASGSLTSSRGMPSKIKGSYYVLGNNATMDMNVIFMLAGSETPDALKGATNATTPENASIPSKDAKFLDEKMDNGVIDSGKIYSFKPSGEGASCSYSTTSTSKDCAIAFGLGI
jgi:prepilin-type N-terminal cleavage/methylation domain-containing protein